MSRKTKGPLKRVDDLLLDLGHFGDLKEARSWVMAHRVVVDGVLITKPGTRVSVGSRIHLRGLKLKYASRGGFKLEWALQRFGVDLSTRVCLDAGASTGGFTDCLLQSGAKHVYAVDVGFGQLRGTLAADSRITNYERTNISDLTPADFTEDLSFACGDLSYLSLRKSVPIIASLFVRPLHLIMLVKPLYEGLPQSDIADPDALARIVRSLAADLTCDADLPPVRACPSPFLGGRGAVEFLFEFRDTDRAATVEEVIDAALNEMSKSPPVPFEEFLLARSAVAEHA